MFQNLNNMYTLDLQGNRIASVENFGFANLPALRHLDISNNQLTVLEQGTFQGTFLPASDVRVLYSCGTHIKQLQYA